jgi:hypothetical protein
VLRVLDVDPVADSRRDASPDRELQSWNPISWPS